MKSGHQNNIELKNNRVALILLIMDAFVVKYDDAESAARQESEVYVKDSPTATEPPVKKVKHDVTIIIQDSQNSEDQMSNLNTSKDFDVSFGSTSSGTHSEGSPDQKAAGRIEDCNERKEKTSSPKPKRRKLSIEELEERKKVKEQARLRREQKREEKLKKEQEKEEMRLKKEQERQAKKEQLERERQAKKELLEKEKMEKQIRKEKMEKERLEKQKKKEEMNLVKEEERKKREEEKKQKEEEKRLKEEEKRKKEEEKRIRDEEEQRKKDKAKESFKSFFIKKSPPKKAVIVDEKCHLFAPFEVKPNMKLAPMIRRIPLQNNALFSEVVEKQESKELYLCELRRRKSKQKIEYVTGRILRTKETLIDSCKTETDEDIIVLENGKETEKDNSHIMHVKLLQFSENYRPPYYGTWRKRSKVISPRNFLKKDENLLNYEVDSDEEWEEEEPGESLSGPENDDEDEEDDENDEENDGFFVPHGYLSDDEGVHDSDGEKQEEKVDIRDKKLDKTEGFPFEEKRKLKQLRATHYGPEWFDSPDEVPDFLSIYNIIPISLFPIDIFSVKEKTNDDILRPSRSGSNGPLKVPEEAMPHLIKFVHKNHLGLNKLIIKFLDIWNKGRSDADSEDASARAKISKRQLERKILEIAKREPIAENGKSCYLVHRQILDQYNIELEIIENGLPMGENGRYISSISGTNICTNTSSPDNNKMVVDSTTSGKDSSISDANENTVALTGEMGALSDLQCNSSSGIDMKTIAHKDEINTAQIQRELIAS